MTGKDESAPPLMTVRQLAQQGDVTVHVVRNYLRRGLLQAATHTEGGYQLFSASELQRLHFILLVVGRPLVGLSRVGVCGSGSEFFGEGAGADDSGYIHDRPQRILVANCMVPADEGPCA